jgi:hypothetical protein
MTTIKGSTNSEGLFTPINPFANYHENHLYFPSDKGGIKFKEFETEHPPALCYNQQGELVIGLNDVEVIGPVWQYKFAGDDDFQNSTLYHKFKTFEDYKNRPNGAESRQIYLTVPPTENADAQPVKEVEKPELTELQMLAVLDSVRNNTYDLGLSANKRASWFKSFLKNLHNQGIHLVSSKAYHSQFATEAGGEKAIHNIKDLMAVIGMMETTHHEATALKAGIINVLSMRLDTLTQPIAFRPNNLVDVEEVKALLQNFHNEGKISYQIMEIMNAQIKSLSK